jgi:hypothetical protein
MMRWFGPEQPYDPTRDPRQGAPEPTVVLMTIALGFTALISLAAASASDMVLLPVAWAVAALVTIITRSA